MCHDALVYSFTRLQCAFLFFFFNDTATTEIYTLSLHDALPIFPPYRIAFDVEKLTWELEFFVTHFVMAYRGITDRKSTRLNSSHANISYAVFCLKKKKTHSVSRFRIRIYGSHAARPMPAHSGRT